jgi:hypothetical protein
MKTVYQDQKTNCFSACLASILELDIKHIPNFYDENNGNPDLMYENINQWLDKHDYYRIHFPKMSLKEIQQNFKHTGYGIVLMGLKDHPNIAHAIVSYNGLLLHNPMGNQEHHQSGLNEKSCWFNCLVRKFNKA